VRGTSYIFKPSKKLTDRVAVAVKDLKKYGVDTNISGFYQFAVEKVLREYEAGSREFAQMWKEYHSEQPDKA
jgi:hypothetical protein